MPRQWRNSFIVIPALVGLVFLFQNCAKVELSNKNSDSSFLKSDNGYPYEGKILASTERCRDHSPTLKLKVSQGLGHLIKDNCNILPTPQPVPSSDLNFENLSYQGIPLEVEQDVINKISFIQNTESFNQTNAVSVSSSAMAQPVSAGNLLICTVLYNSPNATARVSTAQDNLGNVFRAATPPFGGARTAGNGGYTAEVWYSENSQGGAGHRVTFNFSQAMNSNQSVRCFEYAGIQSNNSLDKMAYGNGNAGATMRLGLNGSTNWSNELVFVAYWGLTQAPALEGFTLREGPDDGALDQFVTSVQSGINLEVPTQSNMMMTILTFRGLE